MVGSSDSQLLPLVLHINLKKEEGLSGLLRATLDKGLLYQNYLVEGHRGPERFSKLPTVHSRVGSRDSIASRVSPSKDALLSGTITSGSVMP